MRKSFFVILLAIGAVLLTGCGSSTGSEPAMDQLAEDNKYHYQNPGLGFRVALPSSFEYYQTQKKEAEGYADIEFFVPTSDTENGSREVPGYAKPIVVRVFESEEWENVDEQGEFKKIGEGNNSVYTINFWDNIPEDWREKWNEDIESDIEKSFEF
jgi:hypothetical protein